MQNSKTPSEDFPKADVDYYVFADGEYWPVTSLQRKYKCSAFHVYDRAKKHNIARKKIMDVTLFKDTPEIFQKKVGGRRDVNGKMSAEHLKEHRTAQYAELCSVVRSLQNDIQQLCIAVNLVLNHLTNPTNGESR